MRRLPITACVLRFQGDGGLRDLIESSNDAGIRFVAALCDDEVRELGGDVDVGLFEGAAGDVAEYAACRRANGRLTGGKGGRKIVAAIARKALHIGEAGERDLSDGGGLSVAEGSGNGAIGTDAEIHQCAAGSAILLDGGGAAGGGNLGEESVFVGVVHVPRKGKVVGAVGEAGDGDGRGVGGGTDEGAVAVKGEGTGSEYGWVGDALDVGGWNGNGVAPGCWWRSWCR